ncbi:hypothetical protein RCL1_006316 [Eukaryota sp. TZLM3-RCL]
MKPSRPPPSPRVCQIRTVFDPLSTHSENSNSLAFVTPLSSASSLKASSETDLTDILHSLFSSISLHPQLSNNSSTVVLDSILEVMKVHGKEVPEIPQIPKKPVGMQHWKYADMLQSHNINISS